VEAKQSVREKTEREGKENRLTECSHSTSMATLTMKCVQHSYVLLRHPETKVLHDPNE